MVNRSMAESGNSNHSLKVSIGVVGYGYWGPNIIRNLSEHDGFEVAAIADLDPSRRAKAEKMCPGASIVGSFHELVKIPGLDAVAICTPVCTHFEMASMAMSMGLHVLVEKPLATSVSQADALLSLSSEKGVVLLVDYTFLYTGAVRKIKDLLHDEDFGTINYIDSTRINLGIFQDDVNVLWDLATHDLSIIYYLIEEKPVSVQAIGASHTDNGIENIAYLSLRYASGLLVHLNCSWASPVKIRQIIIGGEQQMIIYDDIQPSDKLKVYEYANVSNSGEDRRRMLVDYRLGEVRIPKFPLTEALSVMVDDFYSTIQGQKPHYSPTMSLNIVRTLVLADESMRNNGKLMLL